MADQFGGEILIVDDEPSNADTLTKIFRQSGYSVTAVYSAEAALAWLAGHQSALALLDVIMPGMDGIDLAKKIRSSHPDCRLLLLSGNATTQDLLEDAAKEGYAFEILAKPIPPPELLEKVASLLSRKNKIVAAG
jgi:CheY-like chemotaxis protein